MLTDRIIGAFTFRRGVYAEVEKDTAFTSTAWLLVVVVGFLNQLGSKASLDLVSWLGGAIGGTIFAVAGFALAAAVISWVGRGLFKAQVTFEELVRTLGLAYVWNVIGVIGVLAGLIAVLGCVLAPVLLVAAILVIVAWLVAAKEALDLGWGETIITVIVGWIVMMVIRFVGSIVLGAIFGLGAGAARGIFSF